MIMPANRGGREPSEANSDNVIETLRCAEERIQAVTALFDRILIQP
jgi:hypothetical protein